MNDSLLKRLISELFEDLQKDYAGQRVLQYMKRQIEQGRDLKGILDDPYVRNRVSDEQAEKLVSSPEVVKASERALKHAFEKEDFSFKE